MFSFCLVACSDDNGTIPTPEPEPEPEPTPSEWTAIAASPADWDGEKRADISYQLLVYSFSDGNGDGYGDINGLISKCTPPSFFGSTFLKPQIPFINHGPSEQSAG